MLGGGRGGCERKILEVCAGAVFLVVRQRPRSVRSEEIKKRKCAFLM